MYKPEKYRGNLQDEEPHRSRRACPKRHRSAASWRAPGPPQSPGSHHCACSAPAPSREVLFHQTQGSTFMETVPRSPCIVPTHHRPGAVMSHPMERGTQTSSSGCHEAKRPTAAQWEIPRCKACLCPPHKGTTFSLLSFLFLIPERRKQTAEVRSLTLCKIFLH